MQALRQAVETSTSGCSPDGGHICLCVLVVRYTYDSSVQALDSRRARRTKRAIYARRQGAGQVSQLTAGSEFAFFEGLWVGLTLLGRNAVLASVLQAASPPGALGTGRTRAELALPQRNSDSWSS